MSSVKFETENGTATIKMINNKIMPIKIELDNLSENIKKVIKSNFVIINKKKKMTRKEYKQDYEYDVMSWMWMGASKCQELIGTDQKCIDTNLASLA